MCCQPQQTQEQPGLAVGVEKMWAGDKTLGEKEAPDT
jgi:hypothetical protein